MTRNLVWYQQTGDLHFVTFSCYQRRPYLGSAEARDVFESALERMRVRYDFYLSAYVVMPEHVHLLMSEPKAATVATALLAVKLAVTKKLPERPFWSKRYYDFNVHSGHKEVEKRRYIHRNPVARGLVAEPEKWARSSFRQWWAGEVGVVEVECPALARRRGGLGERLGPDGRVRKIVAGEEGTGAPRLAFETWEWW